MGETIIKERSIIAVEGKDEENFIKTLLIHLDVRNVQIIDAGGKNNFKRIIPALQRTRGFDKVVKLGIVRDADNSFSNALASVRSALKKAGLPQPPTAIKFFGKDHQSEFSLCLELKKRVC